MLVRNGITREYYSFEDIEEIKRILQFDCFCDYQIDENSKWIEYKIERNLCIRLKDFYHQIKQNLIRIHLGQLLFLVQKILEQVNNLELHQIKHDFIDMNRIWIKLFDKWSQYPNIIYQNLSYSIHFTDLSLKIKEIIKELLNDCFQIIQLDLPFGLFSSDQEKRQTIYNSTIANIINKISMDNSSTFELTSMVISSIQTYKYDANDQIINVDDKKSDKTGSDRHKKVAEIFLFLKKVYDYGIKNNSKLAAESIVNQLIPKFLQIINFQINLDVSLDQQYEQLYDQYSTTEKEKNDELQIYLENGFENLYQNKLIELEKTFKFFLMMNKKIKLNKMQLKQHQIVNHFNILKICLGQKFKIKVFMICRKFKQRLL